MTDQLVWREVQEAIYERWNERWAYQGQPRTPTTFANETFDPPEAAWVHLLVQRRPGGPGTIGKPGSRKMDRSGSVFLLIREPPGDGVGSVSDLAELAAAVFEGCRFGPHQLRFNTAEPLGDAAEIDGGRWWGVTVEARFDYEQII